MKLKYKTDIELINLYNKSNNSVYFKELMDRYNAALYSYIIRKLKNEDDARDIYQETWLKVARSLSSYKDESKFANYLFFIATNACYDHFRRIKNDEQNLTKIIIRDPGNADEEYGNFWENIKSLDLNPEEENIKREQKEYLNELIGNLPENQKEVFLLRSEGFSFKEIAEITKTPINSLLSRMKYALDKLKKAI